MLVVVAVLVVLGAGAWVQWVGQSWGPLAFLTYLPPLLGPTILALVGVIDAWVLRRWRSLLLLPLAMLWLGPTLGYRWGRSAAIPKESEAVVLKLMTCNRGQHNGHQLTAFIHRHQPDVLGLQDHFSAESLLGRPEVAYLTNLARASEFTLFSRFPISKTDLISTRGKRMDGVDRVWHYAARHQVLAPGGLVAVYNVHLPSPRHALVKSKQSEKILAQNYWELQGRMVEELCEKIESDPLPAVVVGDWNVPALGPRYRRMTRVMQDGHAVAGSGYGFTAPGDVRHPLAFWRSWLRLDYVLAGRHWQVLASDTEALSEAQHAAVFAEVVLTSSLKAAGSR